MTAFSENKVFPLQQDLLPGFKTHAALLLLHKLDVLVRIRSRFDRPLDLLRRHRWRVSDFFWKIERSSSSWGFRGWIQSERNRWPDQVSSDWSSRPAWVITAWPWTTSSTSSVPSSQVSCDASCIAAVFTATRRRNHSVTSSTATWAGISVAPK